MVKHSIISISYDPHFVIEKRDYENYDFAVNLSTKEASVDFPEHLNEDYVGVYIAFSNDTLHSYYQDIGLELFDGSKIIEGIVEGVNRLNNKNRPCPLEFELGITHHYFACNHPLDPPEYDFELNYIGLMDDCIITKSNKKSNILNEF